MENIKSLTEEQNREATDSLFQRLRDEWPTLIARNQVGVLTNGLLSPKTLANIMSDKKQNSPPSVRCGKRIGFEKIALLQWLRETGRLKINN